MLVLVKSDNHVTGNATRSAEIEAEVRQSLSRFEERLTRVEVKFFDDNSREKIGPDDLRCVIEARPAGMQPIMVSHQAGSLRLAADGAIDKLKKVLDKTYDKLTHHKGQTSYSGDQSM